MSSDAGNGQPGVLTDPTRTIRVNAKGHEVDQTFIKGIIGAMAVDQIINNYIHHQLDSGSRVQDNDNNVLSSEKITLIWNINGMKGLAIYMAKK